MQTQRETEDNENTTTTTSGAHTREEVNHKDTPATPEEMATDFEVAVSANDDFILIPEMSGYEYRPDSYHHILLKNPNNKIEFS